MVEENIGSSFKFSSSTVHAAEIKSEEITPGPAEGLAKGGFKEGNKIPVGIYKGSTYVPVGEPYGIPGTRGVVPNTEQYRKLMKLQAEWSVSILCHL